MKYLSTIVSGAKRSIIQIDTVLAEENPSPEEAQALRQARSNFTKIVKQLEPLK